MLEIEKISTQGTHTDEWLKQRLGKITASKFGLLVGKDSDKGIFTAGAVTYLENLAGEICTGEPAQKEFFTDATNWGNAYEPDAINFAAAKIGMNILRNSDVGDSHRLIINDEYSGCTPDALLSKYDIEHMFDETGTKLKVAPLETKCPPVHHRFIKLYKCTTPVMLKLLEPIYYWQVFTQMMFTGGLNAYFAVYSPKFKCQGRVIEFKKIELMDDVKKFTNTLHYAEKELQSIVHLLSNY